VSDASPVDDAWLRLLKEPDLSPRLACLRVMPKAACDIFVAVHKPDNRLALFIEVHSQFLANIVQFPESIGFSVEPQSVEPGPRGKVRIVLSAVDITYHDVFQVLGKDVLSHVATARSTAQSVEAFITRLYHWQAFFRLHANSGLSKAEQQGLFGELATLKYDLASRIGISRAVAAWSGPTGSNQDFELNGIAVETKTSSANSHPKVYISNSRQLSLAGIKSLYLAFWLLDVRQGASGTLPELIEELREMASQDFATKQLLSDRLITAGYLDIHVDKYETTAYAIRDRLIFRVENGFPKVDDATLAAGIGDLRYSIELTACLPFKISDKDFYESMS
jgi:hypothetical protein